MNFEFNDVFRVYINECCKIHNKKISLLCADQNCISYEPICFECQTTQDKNYNSQFLKYEEQIQQRSNSLLKRQQIKLNNKTELQILLTNLNEEQGKFNQIISCLKNHINQYLTKLDIRQETKQKMKLFQNNNQKQTIFLKSFIEQCVDHNIDNALLQEFQVWKLKSEQIITQLKSIIEMNKQFLDQQLIINNTQIIKVNGIKELEQTDQFISQLSLELIQDNWDGFLNIIPKFIQLKVLSINAYHSPLCTLQLEEIIYSTLFLPNLKQLNINLIESKANEQTLLQILPIINTTNIKEFCISLNWNQICKNKSINYINLFKEQLNCIPRILIQIQVENQQNNFI